MAYIEGFVIAVPSASKERFIAHARQIDPLFIEQGATRVVEGWGDEVPRGKLTDFYGAVAAKEDEVVCFSWIEWPDKQTRQTGMDRIAELMKSDPRYDAQNNPIPFDGARMIFGGFEIVVDIPRETTGA